ncbi:hypothetical protein FOA52_006334 [Chlamydomonas sp. UWO 241]|nr:hypothetical protein FOA52_006334 [Chlamydomonas sp. UWO 241]
MATCPRAPRNLRCPVARPGAGPSPAEAKPAVAKPAKPTLKTSSVGAYLSTPFGSGRVSLSSLDEEYIDADVLAVKNLRSFLSPRDSPFVVDDNMGGGFVGDMDKIRLHTVEFETSESSGSFCANGLETQVVAAVVTCGGLCPGLNDVVQNIVYTLHDYGVPEDNVLGIKYGLRGFYERSDKPITLTPKLVNGIHLKGGTMLGTSRGGANVSEIVKRIDLWGLTMVFVIGGNGGNAAAHAIAQECEVQGVVCAVIGVPKSIDNDILLVDRCFGFETAVEEAQRALLAAKVEARSAHHGLGLVKLMGRQSGFIAMQASMASGVVDVCLIPEIPFSMEKLCQYIEKVFERQGHCVVCVAEGAGQTEHAKETDASGNPILTEIGMVLRSEFKKFFKAANKPADIKYIDPTYMIRAIPTTANDRVYCKVLGQQAVHAAFAGFSDCTSAMVNTHYVYLPIETIIQAPRRVNPRGRRWNRLVTAIRQPDLS